MHYSKYPKKNRKKVGEVYTKYAQALVGQLASFRSHINTNDIQWLLERLVNLKKVNPRLGEVLDQTMAANGFIFDLTDVHLGSILSTRYAKTSVRDSLLPGRRANPLFQAVFGCELPDNDRVIFINQLAACLPVQALYVKRGLKQGIDRFYAAHTPDLLKLIEESNKERPHFSFGNPKANKDILKTRPHNIVMSESQLPTSISEMVNPPELEKFRTIIGEQEFHTVTICIDNVYNGSLTLHKQFMPSFIGNLRLVDPLQMCTHIRDEFFVDNYAITSLDISELRELTYIGSAFLMGSEAVTSLKTRAPNNIHTIGSGFLTLCDGMGSDEDHEKLRKDILSKSLTTKGPNKTQTAKNSEHEGGIHGVLSEFLDTQEELEERRQDFLSGFLQTRGQNRTNIFFSEAQNMSFEEILE